MSEPTGHEKDRNVAHTLGASLSPDPTEPVATEPLGYVGLESDLSLSDLEKQTLRKAERTATQTTTTSSLTVESQSSRVQESNKSWYRRLDPLKSRRKTPVPKERIVSREYGASFFSMLTFQWMAPLMKVLNPPTLIQAIATVSHTDPKTDWIPTAIGVKRYMAGQP